MRWSHHDLRWLFGVFAAADAPHEGAEHRPTRCLRGPSLGQDLGDGDAAALGERPEFVRLRVDREDLTVLGLGRFAGIDDVGGHEREAKG